MKEYRPYSSQGSQLTLQKDYLPSQHQNHSSNLVETGLPYRRSLLSRYPACPSGRLVPGKLHSGRWLGNRVQNEMSLLDTHYRRYLVRGEGVGAGLHKKMRGDV